MRELALIERIKAGVYERTRQRAVRTGIGDDAAVLGFRQGTEAVVTTDMCLEGRHFRREWHTAESVGHRCLARGLSDLAAMGARPSTVFLSLALPRGVEDGWVEGFLQGFEALARRYEIELAGGDTAQTAGEQVVVDVIAIGTVPAGHALLRSGAKRGQGIYVTGALGAAAAQLERIRQGEETPGVAGRHTFPEPRIATGLKLRERSGIGACIDLSDGLSTDLAHVCAASGMGAEIKRTALPVAEGATLEQALHGGEDYELLFTLWGPTKHRMAGVPVRRIGTVVTEPGVRMDGNPLEPGGWEHFVEERGA